MCFGLSRGSDWGLRSPQGLAGEPRAVLGNQEPFEEFNEVPMACNIQRLHPDRNKGL